MSKSDLTARRLRELLHYDPETGVFTRRQHLNRWGASPAAGEVAGWLASNGYRYISLFDRKYLAHRLAWLYVKGVWPTAQVDHINGVRSDNRFANLRDVTAQVNRHNSVRKMRNAPLLGAHYEKWSKRYKAEITAGGVRKTLGRFDTAEQAHAAYMAAKRELHPGLATHHS